MRPHLAAKQINWSICHIQRCLVGRKRFALENAFRWAAAPAGIMQTANARHGAGPVLPNVLGPLWPTLREQSALGTIY
jgi:hypothetical protein